MIDTEIKICKAIRTGNETFCIEYNANYIGDKEKENLIKNLIDKMSNEARKIIVPRTKKADTSQPLKDEWWN